MMNKIQELKKRVRELIMSDEIENILLAATKEDFNNKRKAKLYINSEGKIIVNEYKEYIDDSILIYDIDFDYYYENDFIKEYKISDYINELNLSSEEIKRINIEIINKFSNYNIEEIKADGYYRITDLFEEETKDFYINEDNIEDKKFLVYLDEEKKIFDSNILLEVEVSKAAGKDYNDFYRCEKNYLDRCFKEICKDYVEEIKDELEKIGDDELWKKLIY